MWKKFFKKIFYLTEVKQNPLVGSPLVTMNSGVKVKKKNL